MRTHRITHLNLDTHTETHAIISNFYAQNIYKQNGIRNQTHN